MLLTEALIEIGKGDKEAWAVRAENVWFAYRDLDIGRGFGYKLVIDETPVGVPGHDRATLITSRLPGVFSWLVEHGKRDLLFGDAWQIADVDELF